MRLAEINFSSESRSGGSQVESYVQRAAHMEPFSSSYRQVCSIQYPGSLPDACTVLLHIQSSATFLEAVMNGQLTPCKSNAGIRFCDDSRGAAEPQRDMARFCKDDWMMWGRLREQAHEVHVRELQAHES